MEVMLWMSRWDVWAFQEGKETEVCTLTRPSTSLFSTRVMINESDFEFVSEDETNEAVLRRRRNEGIYRIKRKGEEKPKIKYIFCLLLSIFILILD